MVVLRPALPEPIQPFSTHGDFADAVDLRQIMGGREAVAAAADDDDVVLALRRRVAPCRPPPAMTAKRLSQQIENRIADGARSLAPIAGLTVRYLRRAACIRLTFHDMKSTFSDDRAASLTYLCVEEASGRRTRRSDPSDFCSYRALRCCLTPPRSRPCERRID